MRILLRAWQVLVLAVAASFSHAFTLPENFVDVPVIEGLSDPDGFDFSPDGRMFISERITGQLRVAKYNSQTDQWTLNPAPFYTFDRPATPRRSGGLRDITFDPDFANNGFVYAFYMLDGDLHNRVVRIRADTTNPDIADSGFGEQLLIALPFNDTQSSGSHNGGALEFGADGKLYITTGDGWEGDFAGDPVQSLTSFTGKVLRINKDGSIPSDNPFFAATSGSYRAIYALGLRNPYSMSKHPDTGELYINEARGTNKASIYIVEAGANYQHEGSNSGIGVNRNVWGNASGAGGELITGGAWMPEGGLGDYPATYNGRYFTALWGGNSSSTGRINTLNSDADPTSQTFATGLGLAGSNGIPVKPVITRIHPATGELYYMLTTYTTNSGQVRRVQFTAQETVAAPEFDPPGGNTLNGVNVTISSDTPGADLHYTMDNQAPTQASPEYVSPIAISASTILRARAFKEGFNASAETSAVYIIGDQSGNQPPAVDAGPDTVGFIGQTITLDGSATTDPDGDDDFLTDEQWLQISGPPVDIADGTEEIAFFSPTVAGIYQFELSVSDGIDSATDTVTHTIIRAPRVGRGLQALYTFEEGGGTQINDVSGVGQALNMTIATPGSASLLAQGGLSIEGVADIRSNVASKIISQCQQTDAITVEVWVETESLNQSGPGPVRIVSLSATTTQRNFTLGQENDRFDTRLRTTATNDNGVPSVTVPASTVKLALTHVIYTRDAAGNANIYVDGVQQVADTVLGSFDNWDTGYALLLGNEATLDREWLGKLYLVGVYCEALTNQEVSQNFAAGLPPFEPISDVDSDGVPDALDNCPDDANGNQLDTDDDGVGDVCDEDRDNDGVLNAVDPDPLENSVCGDSDVDQCDDCSRGVDGFGPASDVSTDNDGRDTDGDTLCDAGDPDDDNDNVADTEDNCPLIANPDQSDVDLNGVGDVCELDLCVPILTNSSRIAVVCL